MSKAEAKVIGTAVNRGGGYGMEIPCIYKFMGQEKNIDLLSKLLDIPNNLFVRVKMDCGKKKKEGNKTIKQPKNIFNHVLSV